MCRTVDSALHALKLEINGKMFNNMINSNENLKDEGTYQKCLNFYNDI